MQVYRWLTMIPGGVVAGSITAWLLLNQYPDDFRTAVFPGTLAYLLAGAFVAPNRLLGAKILAGALLLFLATVFLGELPAAMEHDGCAECTNADSVLKEWVYITLGYVTAIATAFTLIHAPRLYRLRLPVCRIRKVHG